MRNSINISIKFIVIFTIVCGLIYPFFITLIAQLFFNHKANGSLVELNGKIVGSQYIAQNFTDSNYFWGRNSYNVNEDIPNDLYTSSASNLDPDITVEAAYYQAERVAYSRNIPLTTVYALIENNITYTFFHETRFVNVLKLNIELDKLSAGKEQM